MIPKCTLIISFLFLIISCGNDTNNSLESILESNDLNKMKVEKANQLSRIDSINNIINSLSLKINELDTLKVIPTVNVLKTKDSIFYHFLEIQGNVNTDSNVILGPETSGQLNLYVREGQYVKKGQIIGTIKDRGLSQSIEAAKIQANLAKIRYQKQSSLWKQKIGSEIQFLQARAESQAADQQVANLKAQLSRNNFMAPFSGIVDEVITQNGQIAAPGSQIVRLVALNNMKAEAEIPETYLSDLKVGTQAEIYLPAINRTLQSNISKIGNYINPNNRSFKIEIPVQNTDGLVKPNLLAKLKINDYTNAKAIIVPKTAIAKDENKKDYVLIVVNQKENEAIVKKVFVVRGKTSSQGVEIKKGIESGTILVKEGIKNLDDGQAIILNY